MFVKRPALVVLLRGPVNAGGAAKDPAAIDPGQEVTAERSGAIHTIPPDTAWAGRVLKGTTRTANTRSNGTNSLTTVLLNLSYTGLSKIGVPRRTGYKSFRDHTRSR